MSAVSWSQGEGWHMSQPSTFGRRPTPRPDRRPTDHERDRSRPARRRELEPPPRPTRQEALSEIDHWLEEIDTELAEDERWVDGLAQVDSPAPDDDDWAA